MGWMCEPVATVVIEHWARCGTCGWGEKADDLADAQRRSDSHRVLHEDIWERSGNTDLGDYLNPARVHLIGARAIEHVLDGVAARVPHRDV